MNKCVAILVGIILCMGSGLIVTRASGQSAQATSTKKPLTPEVAISLRAESDLHFSPDGKRLAFVVNEPPHGADRARHIWIVDSVTKAARQYTYSKKSEYSPRWAPDGTGLAFLSNRDEQTQIYFLSSDGGEAYALTEGKRSIGSFEWSSDGKQIAFAAPDARSDAEEKKDRDKDDAHVADKDEKHAGLWLFDVETRKAHKIVSAPWAIRSIQWTPAADRLIVEATDHPESDEETDRIFSVTPGDGKLTLLFAPHGPLGEVRVSPDGKSVAFKAARVDGPDAPDVYILPIAGGTPRNLTADKPDRPISDFEWRSNDALVGIVDDGFRSRLEWIPVAGNVVELPSIPVNPHALAFSPAGPARFAIAGGTSTEPNEVWLLKNPEAGADFAVRATNINKSWDSVALVKPEFFRYKSFDGTEIEGSLFTPPGYDGHSKLPTVALIHGGPTGAWSDSVSTWAQLLVARGYAVFCPNIRGSTGYGEKFVEMNRADWGGGDFKDVMAGVDALVARGVADPDKLGIGGWSYGGYMAEWAITQTPRFKASVSGAGMFDLIAEFGTENGPAYDEWFFGQPYEKPDAFLKSSPMMYMKNAKTPTLILQGEEDRTDPVGQSQALYRALKHYGVKTELVTYPREPHGLGEEKHVLDMYNRILAWYDENLKGIAPKPASATASAEDGSSQFGKVDFPTSCNAAAQPSMTGGVALLHSFQYKQAEDAFKDAAGIDSQCAIAYWGEAMSLYYMLWEFPTPETIAEGRKDVEKGQAVGGQTARERDYLAAAAAFFQDDAKLTHEQRRAAYSQAMAKLHDDNPQDVEGAAFYALSIVAMASFGPEGIPQRRQALDILLPLFAAHPDNPGIAHYIIHAADVPALAPEALTAARRYAEIAPDSSHAIHMPSHIFTQMGLWQESIASNISASASAARATQMHMADAGYQFHAMDYLDNAYLQSGQEVKARKVVADLPSVPEGSDMLPMTQSNLEARNAIELRHWKEAASLPVRDMAKSMQETTYLARTIGAARSGDVEGARENEKKLAECVEALNEEVRKRGETVPEGKSTPLREGEAWVALAEGKLPEAMELLRSAAEREEQRGSDPLIVPAREMLADVQLEAKQYQDALASYTGTLKLWPNRFDAVYGAARAAEAAGNAQEARAQFAKLLEISGPGADRPELAGARNYVAAK
jgi:dipeptidyl aminopeptidase/acylaminoacyl peptidase/predicted Zn-dependent protease